MKKSEQYTEAMHAVLTTDGLTNSAKLQILETLMDDRRLARFAEKNEEGKATEDA